MLYNAFMFMYIYLPYVQHNVLNCVPKRLRIYIYMKCMRVPIIYVLPEDIMQELQCLQKFYHKSDH